MADSNRYLDWFEKAQQDLKGAKILMEHDGGYDLVAFHCQQSIEKALKGWLLKAAGTLVDGHSLVYLCRTAISNGAELKPHLKDCAYVNQFYIETRYPADMPMELSKDEARECLDIADTVLNILFTGA